MAKITIVSTTNSIQVDFGDYSTVLERSCGAWRKETIHFMKATHFIEADIVGEREWDVSTDGNDTERPTFQVDSVDGVTPTDLDHLFLLLQALIA